MKLIKGDIFEVYKSSPTPILGHQVNCQGAMYAGIAGQFRKRFPLCYMEYMRFYEKNKDSPETMLGVVQVVKTPSGVIVANLFGQLFYGRDPSACYTSYPALEDIKQSLQVILKDNPSWDLYLPFGMGCGLGGGDQKRVEEIFQDLPGYWVLKE